FRIPVVVHVLYNTGAQNLTDAIIKSNIAALNRDFRKQNSDTVNTPERFKGLAADAEIEFVLATVDPKGRTTSGIVRKQTSVTQWRMDDKIKRSALGGSDGWDPASYLNIWVGHMQNLLGYASSPGTAALNDGIVVSTSSWSTDKAGTLQHLSRTSVHEVGHWLGLKHIWGDTYCGDDLVSDTPPQGNFTAGCPGGFRSSCNNGASGDMYMNYMDFTSDACMNLFTQGQKQRMRSLFHAGGPRASLLFSKGLHAPWLEETPLTEALPELPTRFNLYPNPAGSYVVADFSYNGSWLGKELQVLNAGGTVVKRELIRSKTQNIFIGSLKPGVYFIRASNGSENILQKLVKL
ncbi:MAG: M43 family zinc metalloprotease, partial [Chitinophagaceae bacterium]